MNLKRRFILMFIILSAYCSYAQNAGDTFFTGIKVHTIKLYFDQPNYWDSLTTYYTQGNEQYMVAKVVIDGTELDSCGARLKGNSSYSHPNNKKPMKIDFNEYRDDQKYDGLKGLFLNNCYSDPSFIREKMHLDFCKNAGIAAPRGTFAFIYINDSVWGLYSIVEPVDKKFLSTHFNNKGGNLYKAVDAFGGDGGGNGGGGGNPGGGPGGGNPGGGQTSQVLSDFAFYGDSVSNYTSRYELKTDDSATPWTDLVSVIDVLNSSSNMATDLPQKVNMESIYKGMGTDILFASLDSYVESGRNFYVYFNESTQKMEWIIWDTNMSFGGYSGGNNNTTAETLSITYVNSTASRPLISKVYGNSTLKTEYLKTFADMFSSYFVPATLLEHADSIAAVIRPYVELDSRKQYTLAQFDTNIKSDVSVSGGGNGQGGGQQRIPGIESFITARQASVKTQLANAGVLDVKEQTTSSIPAVFKLAQNYPNPFNPTTTIGFSIPQSGNVTLKIYNVLGREVAALVNGYKNAGNYSVNFDGSKLSSGVYFYELKSGKYSNTKKLLLLK